MRRLGGLAVCVATAALCFPGGAPSVDTNLAGKGVPDAAAQAAARPSLDRSYGGSASQTVCRSSLPLLAPTQVGASSLDYVVVHYTTRGVDAVPRADSDGNGVPDYVECVQAAASRALATYRAWGFRPPRSDRAGGDSRPDIYLKRLGRRGSSVDPFGSTIRDPRGQRFIVLGTNLEPEEPVSRSSITGKAPYQGLWLTVAHETFHLVQNAYLSLELMPAWIKEGTANAWMLLAVGAVSVAAAEAIDLWLRESWHAMYENPHGDTCDRCYGSIVYWIHYQFPPGFARFGIKAPGPTGALLDLLGQAARGGRKIPKGTPLPERAFRQTYSELPLGDSLFSYFVRWTYAATAPTQAGAGLWPSYPLASTMPAASAARHTVTYRLKPLSAARIPLRLPARLTGRVLEVNVSLVGAGMRASVNYGGRDGIEHGGIRAGRPGSWQVDTGALGAGCGLGGTPMQMVIDLWSDTSNANPESPRVDCVKGLVDIIASNASTSAPGRIRFSYRVLPVSVEVPGRDRADDVAPGQLDLLGVGAAVTRDRLTWTIMAKGANLSEAIVELFVDPDRNPSTGAQPGGFDYVFVYQGPQAAWTLWRFEAGSWVTVESGAASITPGEPFPLILWISPAGLGDPLRARFVLRAWKDGNPTGADVMPSSGTWEFASWRGLWTR